HNWDNHTHWTQYLTVSPDYFGPNALPVPEIANGKIKDKLEFENGLYQHFSKGDYTANCFSHLSIPIEEKVVIESYMVPVEYFKFDTLIRDKRATREIDGEGFASGDVYFGTRIQIIENHKKLPDIALGLSFKTASGSQLRNARYTDTPGYFFDLSFGKDLKTNKKLFENLRVYGVLGFYSWQTYMENNQQNDAILYGGGFEMEFSKLKINNSLGGYYGYLNNGDRPMVYHFDLLTSIHNSFMYKLSYQYGINDFPYQTVGLSLIYNVNLQSK
ncbi:MAG: hypothetical protein K9J13_12350, partial [Saprospiraceae bacterium]|nr:hypothetical protein [Saprospiraceae bacterium]